MDKKSFKAAVVTNNGRTVSQHFGPAKYFEIFTVENGGIVNKERRDKYSPHGPMQGNRFKNADPDEDFIRQGGMGQGGGGRGMGGGKGQGRGQGRGVGQGGGQGRGMGQGGGQGRGMGGGGGMGLGGASGQGRGTGRGGQKHMEMAEGLEDCDYVISRGMGYGIYNHLETANITPIVTEIKEIEEAIKALIEGTIDNHPDKLH